MKFNTLDQEQRLEIILDGTCELLCKPQDFWQVLLDSINTNIISSYTSQYCNSYILSHSSLLVFSNRILLITCGDNNISRFIKAFLEVGQSEKVASLDYTEQGNKAEFNAVRLENIIQILKQSGIKNPSLAYSKNELVKISYVSRVGQTYKKKLISQIFFNGITAKALDRELYAQLLGNIPEICKPYFIQEYYFSPVGFSLNAVYQDKYFILHVSPEEAISYLSFESNAFFGEELRVIRSWLHSNFSPKYTMSIDSELDSTETIASAIQANNSFI